MMKKILIAWFFFCSFLFLKTTLGQETNYIDIKGSLYQRIKIYPKWEGTAIYNTRLVVATLKKNLEWSGVFDVKKKKKQANLKFIIAKKNVLEYSSKDNANYEIQDAIEVKVLTQEDKLLLQGSFENSSDPKELENNTIDFVQNIIYKIFAKKHFIAIMFCTKSMVLFSNSFGSLLFSKEPCNKSLSS